MQLLPTGARDIPGIDLAASYVPARDLGGDFYDFLPYGEGKLALALGDVSGKGTAAALYGALAIGILREHVVTHRCLPAEMLATLNERLQGGRLDARFIAMLFAVYDAPKRRLTIGNAGCPYPLLMRKRSRVRVAPGRRAARIVSWHAIRRANFRSASRRRGAVRFGWHRGSLITRLRKSLARSVFLRCSPAVLRRILLASSPIEFLPLPTSTAGRVGRRTMIEPWWHYALRMSLRRIFLGCRLFTEGFSPE